MKKSELKALIREVVDTAVSSNVMYKILRHRGRGLDNVPPPPHEEMTYGQAANWVGTQPPGLSLYYIIVPVEELSSELYKKMKIY